MIIISDGFEAVRKCIGRQTYDSWRKYKKFDFILELEVEEGILWYNTLTREVLLLNSGEIRMLANGNHTIESALAKKWFLIPEDISSKNIVYAFQQIYHNRYPLNRGHLSMATIFTTTDCNARCPYCYECGVTKNTMSEETAQATADYIIRHSGEKLQLKWFGGEPLLNPRVIDLISRRVADAGIKYNAHITTNAYLLDRISDEQIKDIWKIDSVQITIDGTEKEYQKIKRLPADGYRKAVDAVKRIAELEIEVLVRMHITERNFDDLKDLVCELSQEFSEVGNNKRFIRLYASPLFEGLGGTQAITSEERRKIYDKYIEIDELILKSGVDHGRGFPKIKSSYCMADSGTSIVITPTGELTPCEHCSDREIIGNVFDGGTVPEKWYERSSEIPECSTCFYYPQCVRLKMCEALAPCNAEHRRYTKYLSEKAMENAYQKWKERGRMYDKGDRNSRKRSGLSIK